jgi:RNA polymerase sigma-70 factor (ECF subfamily)
MNLSDHSGELQPTDETLVEMLMDDSELALREIFCRYNGRLYKVAVSVLNDEAVAKDLVQELFIDLWRRRNTSHIRNLSNYLSKAIKFQVLKQLRDNKLEDHHVRLAANLQFANQTEDSLNREELETFLRKAVNELPNRCREIFILSRFDNFSHKQIAHELGISTKTVEAQIGKALQFLRDRLEKVMLLTSCLLFY